MKKTKLSICFADLSHFAKLSVAVGEQKAIDILQNAYEKAGDSIIKHGGRIRKYIGDAILFSFAEPALAVAAAEEIISGFRFEVDDLIVRFHVSIATGEVYVGEIGHPSLMVEDVLGEVINRAAVLLKEAPKRKNGIALCDETLRILE